MPSPTPTPPGTPTQVFVRFVGERDRALLREARAAIGEDAP